MLEKDTFEDEPEPLRYKNLGLIGDILTADLNLPDTEPLAKEEDFRVVEVKVNFTHKGESWNGVIKYERKKNDKNVYLHFIIDTTNNERVAVFRSAIVSGESIKPYWKTTDNVKYKHLLLDTREVLKKFRRQGFGELGFVVMEKIVKKMGDLQPDLKVGAIDIETSLASVASLILDSTWLKENGLERFVNKDRNIGFVPAPEVSIDNVSDVLESGVEAFADQLGNEKYVHLTKSV